MALNVSAQSAKKSTITFGGIANGSTVSIMQVRDYPVLLVANKSKNIASFDFTVIEEGKNPSTVYKITGAKLNETAKNYLENMQNKKGKIYIENIVFESGETAPKSDNLVLTFDK